jgi:uncharacterized membrane protein
MQTKIVQARIPVLAMVLALACSVVAIAEQPAGWKAAIKTFEFEVSALHVPAGEDKTLTFEALPEGTVKPGRYRFQIVAETHDGGYRLDENIYLRVGDAKPGARLGKGVSIAASYPVLNGSYKLEAGTATGLLSLEARPGKAANVSFYVQNTGSAVNRDISFNSFKPEKMESIEPGKFAQVEAIITPYKEALVGEIFGFLGPNGAGTHRQSSGRGGTGR